MVVNSRTFLFSLVHDAVTRNFDDDDEAEVGNKLKEHESVGMVVSKSVKFPLIKSSESVQDQSLWLFCSILPRQVTE